MKQLDIADFQAYTFLSEVAASPDGRHCAYVATRCDEETNGYRSCIHLLDVAEGKTRQLTFQGGESGIVWLDDDTLLFRVQRDASLEKAVDGGTAWTYYYALDLRGGEALEHLRIPAHVTWMAPLTRGRFALLAKYDMDETGKRGRGEHKGDYIVADEMPFRQDGLGITNGIRMRAYTFDRKSGTLHPVSDPTQNIESIGAFGSRIIYSARHFEKDSPYLFYGNIAVYDADTGVSREYVDESTYRVYDCGFLDGIPVFKASNGLKYGYQENCNFYYIDERTGKTRLLAENHDSTQNSVCTDVRYASGVTTLAQGNNIYFVGTQGSSSCINRVETDGTVTRLTFEDGCVDGIAVCGGEIIFIAMYGHRLQELYSLRDGQVRRLTGHNEWVRERYSLSPPEHLPFQSGGQILDGFVIKPVGMKPDKKYPGILYIHGGHKLAFGPVFYHEMQVWANRGFFVFYCNPRGSDGRGDAFADVIGRYGFVEHEDLMRFTDACLEAHPQLDGDHLGVGGGSYGGFMTNWVIGHTRRFRCAVSQRGIASWLTMFLTSDTSYQFPLWQFDTDIWMDPARYWEHSPLKYADQCTTPTLFIHSEEDYRCPVSEGISMFYALKYRGVEARLCIFKQESHGLSRNGKPQNRMGRLQEITRWFEDHLLAAEIHT